MNLLKIDENSFVNIDRILFVRIENEQEIWISFFDQNVTNSILVRLPCLAGVWLMRNCNNWETDGNTYVNPLMVDYVVVNKTQKIYSVANFFVTLGE